MQTGGENDHSKTGTDGGYCGQIGRQYRVGVQGAGRQGGRGRGDAPASWPLPKRWATKAPPPRLPRPRKGRAKSSVWWWLTTFLTKIRFIPTSTVPWLRAGINRKSVMLTVGYPPLPFCLDADSRQKLHRAGSRLYSSTGFVLHTLGLPLRGDYGKVPAKDLLLKKGATCLWQSSN